MVKTHNRPALILPGGIVEDGESPAEAARREVLEEVGLSVTVERLLVVQHKAVEADRPSSVQFVFDSQPIITEKRLILQEDEIAEVHWLDPAEAVTRHGAAGQARLAAALAARSGEPVAFLDATRAS
jgi:8-oxo-dGTP pyrophosphatase MutT (NUDIX family)